MRGHRVLVVSALLSLIVAAAAAQVDPTDTAATSTRTDTTQTAVSDTAPPPIPPETATGTATDTGDINATDTVATGTATDTSGPVSRFHLGFELETEAILLPILAFAIALLLGIIWHSILLQREISGYPEVSSSWLKLRLIPLIIGGVIIVAAYFFFVRGLSDETLRIARPRVEVGLMIASIVLLIWWLLPRPGVPVAIQRREDVAE